MLKNKNLIIRYLIFVLIFNCTYLFSQVSSAKKRMELIRKLMQQRASNYSRSPRRRQQRGRNNNRTRRNNRSPNHSNRTRTRTRNRVVKKYPFNVKIKLFNGQTVSGKIKIPLQRITLNRQDGSIRFVKKIKLKNIKKIVIRFFKRKVYKRFSKFTAYYFVPSEYKIVTKNNIVYYYSKPIKPLYSINIKSNIGVAKLKTYFLDFWLHKEKVWYNTNKNKWNYPLYNPPKNIIKEILF